LRLEEASEAGAELQGRVDEITSNMARFKRISADKSFREMSVALAKMSLRASEATGSIDQLGIDLQNANIESLGALKTLDDLIVKLTALAELDERFKAILTELIALRKREAGVLIANADQVKKANELQIRGLQLETKMLRSKTAEEIRRLKLENSFGIKTLLNSELQNEVLARKATLRQKVLDIQNEMLRIEIALTSTILTSERRAALEEQLGIWGKLKKSIEDVSGTVTEANLAEQRLWTDLGQIIENGVGNALEGLITQTKTLKDAMLDMCYVNEI